MLFLAMYTFVIVTMRLCGQRNTSPKMKQRNDTNPQTHTPTNPHRRPRRTRKGNPLTFLDLYIDDICNVSMLIKSIVFADDTIIFYSGDNLSQVCETVSTELGKLHSSFQVNKLSLNIGKTNFMIFGNEQCEYNHVVSINSMNIKRVYVSKFNVDSHLNWREHINHIKSKISTTKCL